MNFLAKKVYQSDGMKSTLFCFGVSIGVAISGQVLISTNYANELTDYVEIVQYDLIQMLELRLMFDKKKSKVLNLLCIEVNNFSDKLEGLHRVEYLY